MACAGLVEGVDVELLGGHPDAFDVGVSDESAGGGGDVVDGGAGGDEVVKDGVGEGACRVSPQTHGALERFELGDRGLVVIALRCSEFVSDVGVGTAGFLGVFFQFCPSGVHAVGRQDGGALGVEAGPHISY